MSTYAVPESLAVSDSGFLFLASTGETFTLNVIGTEIFKSLQSGDSLQAVHEKISEEYEVDRATLERDLDDFVSQLKLFKLIRPV
jgi:hypothetical protein